MNTSTRKIKLNISHSSHEIRRNWRERERETKKGERGREGRERDGGEREGERGEKERGGEREGERTTISTISYAYNKWL